MILDGFLPVFLVGCLGGIFAETAKWYRFRDSGRLPRYVRTKRYWILTGLMVVAGGFLASLYGVHLVNAILATNIGASAPLIVASLAATAPSGTEDRPTFSQGANIATDVSGPVSIANLAAIDVGSVIQALKPHHPSIRDILAGR
jgi:drug/metabolite transporter (DMT)-like permease